MKKTIILAIIVLLILSLAACGAQVDPETTPSETTLPSDQIGTTETTEETEHTHEYTNEVTKEATCAEEGVITFRCSCGDTYTESQPTIDHTFGNWTTTKKPSLTETGTSERICANCGTAETLELPVNTLEQECQSFLNDLLFGMPTFESVDALSGGFVFNWATWHIPQVSWEMDENYIITIVYSIDELDAFSQKYLGEIFDYTYLAEPNKDFMTFDMDKREITVITGGAGGGGYNYTIEALTDHGDNKYTLRYLAVDSYMEDAIAQGCYHYGNLEILVVDDHIQVLSHTIEEK